VDPLAPNPGTIPQQTSYQVSVCNNGASCTPFLPASPLTATVPPPVVVGSNTCPGFANTWILPHVYSGQTLTHSHDYGAFGNNDIVVATFTTPPTLTNFGSGGFLNAAEDGTNWVARTAVLSTTMCDFTPNGVPNIPQSSNVGTDITFNTAAGYMRLLPNTKYYYNIKNVNGAGTPSCSSTDCAVSVTLKAVK
jgi:hypothetical protein